MDSCWLKRLVLGGQISCERLLLKLYEVIAIQMEASNTIEEIPVKRVSASSAGGRRLVSG